MLLVLVIFYRSLSLLCITYSRVDSLELNLYQNSIAWYAHQYFMLLAFGPLSVFVPLSPSLGTQVGAFLSTISIPNTLLSFKLPSLCLPCGANFLSTLQFYWVHSSGWIVVKDIGGVGTRWRWMYCLNEPLQANTMSNTCTKI